VFVCVCVCVSVCVSGLVFLFVRYKNQESTIRTGSDIFMGTKLVNLTSLGSLRVRIRLKDEL